MAIDFLALAQEARSCRRFVESEPLTRQDLHWLLDCARLAPSARNAQELRFITIKQGAMLEQVFPLTRWAGALKDWNCPTPGERPTAFIAVLMPERGGDLLCYDVGIACQTILLAATSRGWGACMIQAFDHKAVAALLEPPATMKIALLMGLGLAKEKRVVAEMPENGSFGYWRDAEGVHHVPKRPLAELIVKEF